MEKYMMIAIEEAYKGVRNGHGGPFGSVIVKDGEIISRGHNEVVSSKDPTAHGEIVAIRRAAQKLERFDLSDCELYTTSEPCPMCYSAIHWSRIKNVYFGANRKDAALIGFDDDFLYKVLSGDKSSENIVLKEVCREECVKLFDEYSNTKNKIPY